MYPEKDCKLCPLHEFRTQVVQGRGNISAKIMLVGEAPGSDEDQQGTAFVGRSGKLLDSLLAQAGITDFYVQNICRCRPLENRVPSPLETKACGQFLLSEICELRPAVIITLGKSAAEYLLNQELLITQVRGQVWQTELGTIITTFHPSYLLRNHGKFDQDVVSDFKKAKEIADNGSVTSK